MKYNDYIELNAFKRFIVRLGDWLKAIPRLLLRMLKAIGSGIFRFFRGIGRAFAGLGRIFEKGDAYTRLSFLIMGLGCAVRGQIVKGFLYLAAQAAFIIFLIRFGLNYLKDLGTLGTSVQERVWDEANQIFRVVPGDNSMLILLYSVMSIFVILFFLYLYASSLKACYQAQKGARDGVRLPSFRDDIAGLLDRKYHAAMLTLPTVMAVAFVILPLVFMILIAFTNYDQAHQPPGNLFTWVGFENFKGILGDNPKMARTFRELLAWTVIWAVAATVTNYVFGMILAIMINKRGIRYKKFWRTLFILTVAVPQFVTLLLMSRMLSAQGPVNQLLLEWGLIDKAVPFLTNGTLARITVIVVNMWVGIPYSMLITTGILLNIPNELYESARIDGAGPVKTFSRITLPYMLFVTTPYLITQFVGNFNNFNVIYLLTQGNPKSVFLHQAGETDLLVTWLYKLTVDSQDFNLASTIGIMVFLISAVLSLIVYNSSAAARKEEQFQ